MSATAQLFEVLVWVIDGEKIDQLPRSYMVLANEQSLALKKGVDMAMATARGLPINPQFFATLKTSYRGRLSNYENE